METILTINGLNENVAYCEAMGLSKCFEAYANEFAGDTILEVGFNPNSGYVYIALEDYSVSICSMLGRAVEYLVTDFETGEEFFFDTMEEAREHLETLNA